MSDDNSETASSARENTIRNMLQRGSFGAAELGSMPVRPSTNRLSTRDLGASQQTYQVPASQLFHDMEARKTNEQLAQMLELAQSDAEEQRKVARAARCRGNASLVVACVAAAVTVAGLVVQIVS